MDQSSKTVNADDVCALSPLQQSIFAAPSHAGFVQQALWPCKSPLAQPHLQRAWELTAQRHAILRTVFRQSRKQPVQVVRSAASVSLDVHDLGPFPQEGQRQRIEEIAEREQAREFDLANGPLYRVSVFRLSPSSFATLLSYHAILLDQGSVELVRKDVTCAYSSLQNGDEPLAESAPGIKLYLLWMKGQNPGSTGPFWRAELEGAPACLLPSHGESMTKIHREVLTFTPESADRVRQVARRHEVGPAIVLQSAWALMLSQYTNSQDVTFGLGVTGRPSDLRDSSEIAGKFAHAVPVRVRLQDEQTVSQYLASLSKKIADVRAHGDRELNGSAVLAGATNLNFNTAFVENSTTKRPRSDDTEFLTFQYFGTTIPSVEIDIADHTKLSVCFSYPLGGFEGLSMNGIVRSFEHLVGWLVANSEARISDLEIIPPQERERLLNFGEAAGKNRELLNEVGVSGQGQNAQLFVLLQQGSPAPVKVVGEIAVAGISHEQGAPGARVVSNPLNPEKHSELWLTGKKGFWNHEGQLILQTSTHPEWPGVAGRADGYVAPVTDIETVVARVWEEVLGVARAGLNDDFFDLGGQSLKTIQIRSRLTQRLGLNVPLKTIFANSRLGAQARAIALLKNGAEKTGNNIPRLPERIEYPVSHAQRRLWFLHRLDPDDRFYHTADYIQLEGTLNRAAFEQAFLELVERQAILRTCFKLVGDEPVQVISPDPIPLPFKDLSGLTQQEQDEAMKLLREQVPQWLSNLEVPPVGALLIKLADEKHAFLLAVHHILSDAWSGQVVLQDLMQLYSAACRKQPAQLPEIRARYADFAAWQKNRIEGGKLAESERYWLQRLSGELPKLNLPMEPGQNQGRATDLVGELVESGPEIARHLAKLAKEHDVTPFMLRLAIFKAFLSRVTGQKDVLLGSTTAGRDHPDIEPLVGLFVNVVALRTKLDGDPSFVEILKRVKQTCIEAYAHQEYPFDLLVQRLAPVRESEQLPMLQAFFAELPAPQPMTIEGVRFSPIDVSAGLVAGLGGRKLPVGLAMVCQDAGSANVNWRLLLRADCFSTTTAQRLSRQFKAFLENLLKAPESQISEISTISPERKNLPLAPMTGKDEFPLSLNQRDMWFQQQIHNEAGINNLGVRVILTGPLDVERFRQALQAVVDRHAVLRTVIIERAGVPCQKVLKDALIDFATVDLRSRNKDDQEKRVNARQYELVGEPYNFSCGPLFRAELLRLSDELHAFIFAFSHLILDAMYVAELFEQAAIAYKQLVTGGSGTLPPLAFQYHDVAQWQEERLKQGRLEEHQVYWQQQLQPPLPAISLPADGDTRTVRSFELGFTQWQVHNEVFEAFKSFRKRYRTSTFRAVLAAFEILLRKITGEEELLLGVPFSSLPSHVSGNLGFFAHAVPVRATLDDAQPFTKVLADVNAAVTRAQENLEYPLYEAVRGLQINRDPHRPLFPVVVSQVRALDTRAGDLRLQMEVLPFHAGVYHLALMVLESKNALQLGFYYNREIFHGRPLAMIQECFNELLAQIARAPEVPIRELSVVSDAERTKTLQLLAGAQVSTASPDQGFLDLFEEQVEKRPHAIAATFGKEILSYGALNERANRLAHWLRSQGLAKEQKVGIFGARSLEMLSTMLAVLKAGAAFVPLDPEQPDARLKNILAKADLQLVACSGKLVVRSKTLLNAVRSPTRVICWHIVPGSSDTPNPETWIDEPVTNPGFRNGLTDLAYVCHTSGSTGIPKGAMVEHCGMMTHLLAKINFLGLKETSAVAQNASHCFDISIWQFFAALIAGGRVVIYPPESLAYTGSMLKLIEEDGITVLETVPSLLEMMLSDVTPDVTLPELTHLISNAELLPVPLGQQWSQRFPHVTLVNTYGATECSDDTTHHVVSRSNDEIVRIPVGCSIPGAQHYVLDQALQPLPAGCAGQIVIAGDVVGRGYLADAAATARTFVPDPFRGEGRRLYLTGDVGRWNSAGELEFLGRTDNQVKLHGLRVELTEIEAALAKVAGVRQVAVVISEEGGSARLLAYWVGVPGLDASALRDHAQKELPSSMVPNAFVQMPVLPLTANGKVDRQALPKPADSSGNAFVPPRDQFEFRIANLWRQELGVSTVGVFENFFERGGHSLKAVSMINRLQNEFNISLPLRTLFDHQTIDRLSRVIRERFQSGDSSRPPTNRVVMLQAGSPSILPLFLVHPHGGTVFCYQALSTALGDEVPVYGIQCCGLEEGESPICSIPEMASEYIKDILRVQSQGPYQIAGWSMGGPLTFEIGRQLESDGHKIALLGIFDSALPISTGKQIQDFLPASIKPEEFGSQMSMATFARWFFRAEERQLDGLNDEQIVATLKQMAQRAGILPPDASPAMMKRFIAVAISSAIALFQYKPDAPVHSDLVLFRAQQSLVADPQWWSPWTHGTVHTVSVDGSHHDMVFPPAVRTLAGALKQRLRVDQRAREAVA
jgi:amino acid adenylation domain-containing protein